MRIGVKYCGGCNPRYDRTDIIRRLKADFPGAEIISAAPGEEMDCVAVICGCTSACANKEGLAGKYEMEVLTGSDAYEKLFNRLKQLQRR